MKRKCIELFAGAGGLALGLEKAGFEEIGLVEIDKTACETLRLNRPNWNVIEEDIVKFSQKDYMKSCYFMGGGRTGIARRISWDEPSLTLTCSPMMKQTDRCHPDESRPFTTREYARIQSFPDEWNFAGKMNDIYIQIGNAVPVELAKEVGISIMNALNKGVDVNVES